MPRIGSCLAATLCCVLFSPALLLAKTVTYWYQPHYMAQVKDASTRLQFLAPHFIPGNKYGIPVASSSTFTLNQVNQSNLGINFFFTETGVEEKSNGLLSLTTTKVPYKKDDVVSIVFADIMFFEIRNITNGNGPAPWCVVPYTKNGYQDNILCVPSEDVAHQVADALATLAEAYGTDLRTSFSTALRPITEKELRKHPEQAGCQVEEVDADGPAAEAGIKEGDIVHTVNGATCTKEGMDAAVKEATPKPQGGMVHMEILRKGNALSVDLHFPHVEVDAAGLRKQIADLAQPATAPAPAAAPSSSAASARGSGSFHLGISVRTVIDSDLSTVVLPKAQGVIITRVEKDSLADEMQMQVGDVVLQVNGADFADSDAFAQLVRSGAAKSFRIWRKGQSQDLTVPQSM